MVTTPSATSAAASSTVTKTQSEKSRESVSQNYQDFLKLLTTQLQNQDPSDPTDTNQLTQQIATLSQVEQQVNTNSNLEKLISLVAGTQIDSVVPYIDKLVEASGDLGSLTNGKAYFGYTLASEAENVTVKVTNTSGDVVYTGDGTKLAGRNLWTWDGKNNSGTAMPNGTYKIQVSAKNTAGETVASSTSTVGIVTSVEQVDGATMVALGDILVPLGNITSVRQKPTA